MISRITTFAVEGVEARPIDVQVQLSGGANAFNIVGLPDKAVGESRERVRAAEALTDRFRPAEPSRPARASSLIA